MPQGKPKSVWWAAAAEIRSLSSISFYHYWPWSFDGQQRLICGVSVVSTRGAASCNWWNRPQGAFSTRGTRVSRIDAKEIWLIRRSCGNNGWACPRWLNRTFPLYPRCLLWLEKVLLHGICNDHMTENHSYIHNLLFWLSDVNFISYDTIIDQ